MKNQFLRDGGIRCTGLYIPRSGTVTRLHRPHHGQITSRKKHPRLASWTKASQKFLSQNQNSTWFVAPIESSSYNPPMFTSDVTQLRPRSLRVGFFLCSSFVDVFSCFCLSFLVRMPLFLFHCMFLLHGGCLLRFFARFLGKKSSCVVRRFCNVRLHHRAENYSLFPAFTLTLFLFC